MCSVECEIKNGQKSVTRGNRNLFIDNVMFGAKKKWLQIILIPFKGWLFGSIIT